MINPTLDPQKHTTSTRDALAYWLVRKLGDVQTFLFERVIQEPVWRSFDGSVHVPRTMTDRHLRHTVNMLLREGDIYTPIYRALRDEFNKRTVTKIEGTRVRLETFLTKNERQVQLDMIAVDYTPDGWICTHGDSSNHRSYRTEEGHLVALNSEGTWSWWKPKLHHYACQDPKKILAEALGAALS